MNEFSAVQEINRNHYDLLKHLSTLSAMMIAIFAALGTMRRGLIAWGVVVLTAHLLVSFLLMNVLLNQNGYISKIICQVNQGNPEDKAAKCFPAIRLLSHLAELLFVIGVILIAIYFVIG